MKIHIMSVWVAISEMMRMKSEYSEGERLWCGVCVVWHYNFNSPSSGSGGMGLTHLDILK